MDWFTKHGDKFTDSGNPFMPGKEVTNAGVKNLPHDKSAITGYSIIKAESIDEAVKIAQDCPSETSRQHSGGSQGMATTSKTKPTPEGYISWCVEI